MTDPWRQTYLRLYAGLSAAGGALYCGALVMHGQAVLRAPSALAAATAAVTAVLAQRTRKRSVVLVSLAALALTTLLISQHGFAPGLVGLQCFIVVSAAVLAGRKAALALTATLTLGNLLWVALFANRVLEVDQATMADFFDLSNPAVGLRIVALVALLAGGLGYGVSQVLEHAEDALAREHASFLELQRVSAERRRERDELARARELEVLGRLAAVAAHDFNNSLTVVTLAATELRSSGVQSPALDDIDAAVKQAQSVTSQLRELRPRPSSRKVLPVAPFLSAVAATVSRVVPSNLEVKCETSIDDARIEADEGTLQRVLLNLALNARDAMPEGGQLTLRARHPAAGEATSAHVVLEVQDTGVGIAADLKDKVFEPWFSTKGDAGTGLGLASTRELVTSAGGTVWLTSAPGRGTTVSVSWPLATPSAGARPTA